MTQKPLFPLIVETFRKARGGPAPVDREFWTLLASAAAKEIRDAKTKTELLEELADLTFISVDGIAALGADPETVIRRRLKENGKKRLDLRDMDYYREKAGLSLKVRRGCAPVGNIIAMSVTVVSEGSIVIGNRDFGVMMSPNEARQLAALLLKAVRP